MTQDMLLAALERKIVRYCSPTLRNIKPANLFTFVCECERACSRSTCAPFSQPSDQAILRALRNCARRLRRKGILVRILARCANGPVIYLYRPDALEASLRRPEVAALLANEGYRTDSLDACLDHLSERFQAGLPSNGGPCEFPHEIGLFLGYPFEDVVGFIENRGRDFLRRGCWKAYHDALGAQRTWAYYETCTCICEGLISRGMAFEDIVLPSAFVECKEDLAPAI